MGGFLKGLGGNCEVLMFIILFLLLFWDRRDFDRVVD
jgi:hypothetical protein